MRNGIQSTVWILSIVSIFLLSSLTRAAEVSFVEVWRQVKESSATQKSIEYMTQATREDERRANRHWLPKFYLDTRLYQSNDPGNVFFGLLEQRSIVQNDFAVDSLNSPGSKTFSKLALVMDLPFYEGGLPSAKARMLERQEKATQYQGLQNEIEQYAMTATSYGNLIVFGRSDRKVFELKEELNRIIKSYQLGSRSNPVGYSGLLGLKSIGNKILAIENQLNGEKRAHQGILHSLGLVDEKVLPSEKELGLFIQNYLLTDDQRSSYRVESLRAGAQSNHEVAQMERAKLRPRIGAFAESYSFTGSRDAASGYTAGVYLQWSLFNAADVGQDSSLHLKIMAQLKAAEAAEQREAAEKQALWEERKATLANLDLLEKTESILLEQTKVATDLFRSGSINALQLVEIFNRRAELIQQMSEAEKSLIRVNADLISKVQFLSSGSRDQINMNSNQNEVQGAVK